MRFPYARSGGAWAEELVPGAGDYHRWDVTQSKIVSGDVGSVQPASWAALTTYAVGNVVVPNPLNGFAYTCTVGGESDNIPPAWPPKVGASIEEFGSGPTWLCTSLDGSYHPSSPIVIGGAGVVIDAAAGSSPVCAGGVTTATGGRIRISAAAGDVPQLAPPRTRSECVPVVGGTYVPANLTSQPIQVVRDDVNGWGVVVSPGTGLYYITFDLPGRYMHIGARLASLEIEYVILALPTALPTNGAILEFGGLPNVGGTAQFPIPSPGFTLHSWAAATTHAVGDYVAPTSDATNTGYYFKCTAVTGDDKTGSVEPNWSTASAVGLTIVDNHVTWTCTGRSGWRPLGPGVTPQSYYAAGAPQVLGYDTDGTTLSLYSNIISGNERYTISMTHVDPNMLITGIKLYFDSITSMQFE